MKRSCDHCGSNHLQVFYVVTVEDGISKDPPHTSYDQLQLSSCFCMECKHLIYVSGRSDGNGWSADWSNVRVAPSKIDVSNLTVADMMTVIAELKRRAGGEV